MNNEEHEENAVQQLSSTNSCAALNKKDESKWEERRGDGEHMVHGDLASFPLTPFPLISCNTWD